MNKKQCQVIRNKLNKLLNIKIDKNENKRLEKLAKKPLEEVKNEKSDFNLSSYWKIKDYILQKVHTWGKCYVKNSEGGCWAINTENK
jgi:hypothetical protein